MKLTQLQNRLLKIKSLFEEQFLKAKAESYVSINLGNYFLKGLVANGEQISDYFIEPSKDLEAAIKKVWAEKKITTRRVKISVKNPACLVRYFSFPKLERKKLQQALFYELNKFIPFPPADVYFDYCILKELSPQEVFILLAVAKKDFINSILEIFKKNNLKISEINLDSICLVNLFLESYDEARQINSCILDIGYNFSTMTIINKNVPFLTRDVKFCISDIYQIIARTKNISVSEVGNWLASLNDKKEFQDLVQDSISNLCREIKSSFDYFEVSKGEHLDKLYLSGGMVSVRGIENIFSEILDIKVEILNVNPKNKESLAKILLDEKFSRIKNNFAVAFGLI